eukprot:5880389-Prymnesium_polylepis.3
MFIRECEDAARISAAPLTGLESGRQHTDTHDAPTDDSAEHGEGGRTIRDISRQKLAHLSDTTSTQLFELHALEAPAFPPALQSSQSCRLGDPTVNAVL